MTDLALHHLRIQGRDHRLEDPPAAGQFDEAVRAWLTALVGAEHLSLLVGSGLGISVANAAGATGLGMARADLRAADAAAVDAYADESARAVGRGEANIEDQLRAALQMYGGLEVLEPGSDRQQAWKEELDRVLGAFAEAGLAAERGIREAIDKDDERGRRAAQLLIGLLLAFASRAPTRERLNVFTTNYDRLIEYGADLGGLRVLDRFVGSVEPVFRASRLDIDVHYNPPGIRGEPRYLEGVIRLCKLHGSLDWRFEGQRLRRIPLAFGGEDQTLKTEPLQRLMIYPNAAKDVETLLFPYAELFRDLSAAICRPNGVLVTFGYGFGDDHINRIIRDMLTLRSTHLLVIAWDDPGGRIAGFVEDVGKQCSLMIGEHFGDLGTLVDDYMPQPGPELLLLHEAARVKELNLDDGGDDNKEVST